MAHQVVICGGGIIGAATAYYLTQKGVQPLVLEAVAPACSSSGKAGGFLALDWCAGSQLDGLARASFELHAQLADTLGVDCGYRRMRTHSISLSSGRAGQRRQPNAGGLPDWVRQESVLQASVIGTEVTTAQVHPELLTKALLAKAGEAGAALRIAAVVGVEVEGQLVTGLRVRDKESGEESLVTADQYVFCMGVWSEKLRQWFPQLPAVTGQKVHSIVLNDPEHKTTADALFLAYRGSDGKSLEPEVYPRPNGTVYVCGVSEVVDPPSSADQIAADPAALERLRAVAASVSPDLGAAELERGSACFLPNTEDGLPLIGPVPGIDNAFVAAGHSCWGVLLAPATGQAMAELLTEGAASTVPLQAYAPSRLVRRAFRS